MLERALKSEELVPFFKKTSYEKLTHLIFTCFKVRKHFFCELSKEATCPCASHTDRELNAACKNNSCTIAEIYSTRQNICTLNKIILF